MLIPPPNLPAAIRTDETNAFAHNTLKNRLPGNILELMERNPDYPTLTQDALQQLYDDMKANAPMPMLDPMAPDYNDWLPAWQQREGQRWQNTDWFFAETFFYRHIITCTRWWETGRDPFKPNKDEEYATDSLWELLNVGLTMEGNREEKYAEAISLALWGNRIDLSFKASMEHGTTFNEDDLIDNDSEAVVQQLIEGSGPVHFLIDNAGTELTMDLALVDLLVADGIDVVLHLKLHPTFVSDATPADVWNFLALTASGERGIDAYKFGQRLYDAIHNGRLRLMPNLFWNSSLFLWQLPDNLARVFADARLTIVKGDANYRRILGDAIWEPTTPFEHALGYFPSPVLALRTLKSDPIVGLEAGMAQKLDAIDPQWHVNGRRGIIQYRG